MTAATEAPRDDAALDRALIAAAFEQAGVAGWRGLNLVRAASTAGLPLDRVRARFPGRPALLMRFGLMADQVALSPPSTEPLVRDRLFELLMRRFDVLQRHRAGVLALLRALPAEPGLALLLSAATGRSMAWLLEAAGVSPHGVRGRLRVSGLVGVWLYTLRAWRGDDSEDMAATMAALDRALDRAEQLSGLLRDTADTPPEDNAPPAEDTPEGLPPA